MRPDLLHAAVLIGMVGLSDPVSGQTTIVGATGSIYRYHGDTIWQERDTTVSRTIARGDTVTNFFSINGVMRYEVTYVVRGDSARLIDAKYGPGFERAPESVAKSAPTGMILMHYRVLETEYRSALMRDRMSSVLYDLEPPRSPEPPRTYDVSAELRMTQHRDTVFYVRGCPSFGRVP